MLKQLFFTCFMLLSCLFVSAQSTKTISGIVTDSSTGETLIGVSVVEPGTSNGTVTDIDGKYTINVKGSTVSFSYVGYKTQTLTVIESGTMNVKLSSDTELDDVVVVGYAAQKKSSITGALAPVNMDDVNKRHTLTVSQALQGQISGVQITQSTGAPGDEINVLIRGEGTIGNNSPLYIIDGIPSRSITFLNPSDIASVTVLKDASAAAVYGSRAAGGVVVITTKEGELGKNNVEINYTYGLSRAVNIPKMLNSSQYLNVQETAWKNSGYAGTNPYTGEINRPDIADTDWTKELFTTGVMHNIQATLSGGNTSSKYLLSMGYIKQDGIVVYDNDKYERFNLRLNLNTQVTKDLTVGANVQLTYAIQDKLSSKGDDPGIIRHAMLRPPVLSVYKNPNDPTYNPNDPFTDLPFYKHNNRVGGWESDKYEWTSNPIALAKYTDDKRRKYTTFGNVYGEYNLLPDKSLKFRSNMGLDMNIYHDKAFGINFGDDDGGGENKDKGLGRKNRPNNLNESRGENRTFIWNNTLNYVKTLGIHSINAVGGTEYITNFDSSIGASRRRFDYTRDSFRYLDFGAEDEDMRNSGSASEWALMSYFASATYVFDNRYMMTANFRADASSRFAENNKWGYFPSLSVGWKMNEEQFMRDINWLSDLKLRGSWGQLGNQEIENYAYLPIMQDEGEGYVLKRFGNPDLKWETTEQLNVGVDFGILKNKLYLSLDYFNKKTYDILLPVSLPLFIGNLEPTIRNSGSVVNKGFEMALIYRDEIDDLKYSMNVNMATLKNEVTKLHSNLPVIEEQVSRTVVGQPLNSYYGFQMEGIYQNQNEINEHQHKAVNPSSKPGDIRFKDIDKNGVIDDNDRTFLGSPIPKLTYGFTLNGEYKGFNLSMFFHGISGVKRFNDLKKILDYDSRPFNHTTAVLDAWHGEGTSNSIPRRSFTDVGGSRISSIFVENASFFRLKNIELGYSFANQLKKAKSKIGDVRLYVTAENLFTITSYSGLDPESTDLIDYGTYPQARTVLFGVNVKF